MTKIIGITGGIGSGKSTLSNYLKKEGFLVHDSDFIVSNMYKNPKKKFTEFLKKLPLKNAFKNKKINKQEIRNKIFNK